MLKSEDISESYHRHGLKIPHYFCWYNTQIGELVPMSPDPTNTKTCPTCGTRVSDKAVRCPVCGNEMSGTIRTNASTPIRGSRMPELTLTLPAALGLLAIFVAIGAGAVYFALKSGGKVIEPTPMPYCHRDSHDYSHSDDDPYPYPGSHI